MGSSEEGGWTDTRELNPAEYCLSHTGVQLFILKMMRSHQKTLIKKRSDETTLMKKETDLGKGTFKGFRNGIGKM